MHRRGSVGARQHSVEKLSKAIVIMVLSALLRLSWLYKVLSLARRMLSNKVKT